MPVRDYSKYVQSRCESARSIITAIGIICFAAAVCYGSLLFVPLLLPYVPIYIRRRNRKLAERQRWTLNLQFCEGINCISAALEAGYSIESAIAEAQKDLRLTYDEDSDIIREFKLITVLLRNGHSVEEAFSSLAERSGIEDIMSFADVFATAKRTGGDIISIIRACTDMIRTRVELKRELRTAIASKKYEADIMKIIPFGILIYLRLFSPDMVAPLYGTLPGFAFMSAVLVIYVLLCRLSDRIVSIEL